MQVKGANVGMVGIEQTQEDPREDDKLLMGCLYIPVLVFFCLYTFTMFIWWMLDNGVGPTPSYVSYWARGWIVLWRLAKHIFV